MEITSFNVYKFLIFTNTLLRREYYNTLNVNNFFELTNSRKWVHWKWIGQRWKGRHENSSNGRDINRGRGEGGIINEGDKWRTGEEQFPNASLADMNFPSRLIFNFNLMAHSPTMNSSIEHRSPQPRGERRYTPIPSHAFSSSFFSPSIVFFFLFPYPCLPPPPPPCCCSRKCIKGAAFNLGGCAGNATSDPDLEWKDLAQPRRKSEQIGEEDTNFPRIYRREKRKETGDY